MPLPNVKRLCGAHTDHGPCKNPALANGRCRMHNGNAAKGIAHPNFKHGRRSKDIPARLAGRYLEAQADPELLSTRDDIALVDARLGDLLTRVDTGEAGKHWTEARKANDEILRALNDENYGALGVACIKLDRCIGDAQTDIEAWGQIQSLLETRRKLSDSEQKRLVAMQQMITAEQAATFAAALTAAVVANVTDRKTLAAIQSEFARIMTREVAPIDAKSADRE